MVPSRPIVLGHRGAPRVARENTLDALVRALGCGADGVEIDARLTADGVAVLSHDPALAPVGPVAEATFAHLRRLAPWVPTLEEALDACAGSLVNIELKALPWEPDFSPDHRLVTTVATVLEDRGAGDQVLVSSFHLEALDRIRALRPEAPTAFLTLPGVPPLAAIALARERGHSALHPETRSLAGDTAARVVEQAHANGIRVHVWTVNEPDEMRRLAELGADGIVTDVPDLAVATLGA